MTLDQLGAGWRTMDVDGVAIQYRIVTMDDLADAHVEQRSKAAARLRGYGWFARMAPEAQAVYFAALESQVVQMSVAVLADFNVERFLVGRCMKAPTGEPVSAGILHNAYRRLLIESQLYVETGTGERENPTTTTSAE